MPGIEVAITDENGNNYGPGPIEASRWRHTRRLDRAGEITFEFPAPSLRNSLIVPKRYVHAYAIRGGVKAELGAGIIEEHSVSLAGGRPSTMTVTGGDMLRELARPSVYDSDEADEAQKYSEVGNAPQLLIADFGAFGVLPVAWTITGNSAGDPTGMLFYGQFVHESLLGALAAVAQSTGEHFRLGTGRQVVWIGPPADFADCGVRAETNVDPIAAESNADICLITSVGKRREGWNLFNRVFASGAGRGEDRITLEFMTDWPDGHAFVSDISSISDSGGTVTVVTARAHGFSTGNNIEILGTVNFDGIASSITVTDTDTFTYTSANTGSETTIGVAIGPPTRTIGGESWTISRGENYLQNDASITTYGIFPKSVTVKNITPVSFGVADLTAAANALGRAIYNWINQHKALSQFYDLSVAGLNQTVYPGQTMRVVVKKFVAEQNETTGAETRGIWLDIDANLYILETVEEFSERGSEIVGLTVATLDRWPDTGVSTIVDEMKTTVEAIIHPQPGESVDTTSSEQPIDADNDFTVHFRLPAYIQRVKAALLWFRVDQLTSPVRSVGGTSTTTASGGSINQSSGASSKSTADAESAHAHTIPGHQHDITIAHAAATDGDVGNVDLGGGDAVLFYTGTDIGDQVVQTDSGSGGTTSAAGAAHGHGMDHTHNVTVAGHTHDVTGTIKTVWGVFREALANTLAYTDLDITINGLMPRESVIPEGSGWYSLDLTPDVASGFNGVPLQVLNSIVFSDGTGTVNISSISGDGTTVTVVTASVHGLSSGVNVRIGGTVNHDGIWLDITVTATDTFTYESTITDSETTGTTKQYQTANIVAEREIRTSLQSIGG